MKKTINFQNGKVSVVNCMNACALAFATYSINVTCGWLHYQPEVPKEAMKLRKF